MWFLWLGGGFKGNRYILYLSPSFLKWKKNLIFFFFPKNIFFSEFNRFYGKLKVFLDCWTLIHLRQIALRGYKGVGEKYQFFWIIYSICPWNEFNETIFFSSDVKTYKKHIDLFPLLSIMKFCEKIGNPNYDIKGLTIWFSGRGVRAARAWRS